MAQYEYTFQLNFNVKKYVLTNFMTKKVSKSI